MKPDWAVFVALFVMAGSLALMALGVTDWAMYFAVIAVGISVLSLRD